MSAVDFAEMLAPHVDNRRVFLSACQAAQSEFAKSLLSSSECWSVLAPVDDIYFDDAAIFWSGLLSYHVQGKSGYDGTEAASSDREEMCRSDKCQIQAVFQGRCKVKSKTFGSAEER